MKQQLPNTLLKDDYQMDEALHLSKIDPHSNWLHLVFSRIRLLEYLGYNYNVYQMEEELSSSYCELYMESLASVIEAILRSTFHNKYTRYCTYIKCPYMNECPVLFFECEGEKKENMKLTFFELIAKAEEVGIFSSLSVDEIHFIRQTRNYIHLPSCGDEIRKEREKITSDSINSSIKILKRVISECITWLYNPNLAKECKKRLLSEKVYI